MGTDGQQKHSERLTWTEDRRHQHGVIWIPHRKHEEHRRRAISVLLRIATDHVRTVDSSANAFAPWVALAVILAGRMDVVAVRGAGIEDVLIPGPRPSWKDRLVLQNKEWIVAVVEHDEAAQKRIPAHTQLADRAGQK